MKRADSASRRAMQWITSQGGMVRSKDAVASGIYSRTLSQLLKQGKLEQPSRGFYRIASRASIANPDLVTVAIRIPSGVICLISALSFHKLTTQIPHKVYVAIPEGARSPKLDHPPLAIHRYRGRAFSEGVQTHLIDGIQVRIYSPEKTLADCFKFRNKIGLDIVLEALKRYRSWKKFNMQALTKFAKICRVEKQMQPYLEAIA
ncbi:MAG: type IV toxin-antitoxin system AbiEi family antitoxin domain-containing protein [Bacteroidetes bacterium]|nr:type IV toxin-antitoxin system AbiEi family antitoxin domain-containing protein [Bacteroidota bacterium]